MTSFLLWPREVFVVSTSSLVKPEYSTMSSSGLPPTNIFLDNSKTISLRVFLTPSLTTTIYVSSYYLCVSSYYYMVWVKILFIMNREIEI